jgi:phosphoglycerate dehydrogenase-like enzyme
MNSRGSVNVLISSFLEADQVDRIAAADDRLRVLYDRALVPSPRYLADHGGVPPQLDDRAQQRWLDLLAQADIAFDFDWQAPQQLLERAPNLKWVQATSAGVGGFLLRTGLHDSDLVVTTAAGVHAIPLAEFAVAGTLHFVKGFEALQIRKRAKLWQRYTTQQLAGRAVTVVGLGHLGRQTVRHFAALGARVTGVGRPGRQYDLPDEVRCAGTDKLGALLPGTDVLVLCCALTAETEGLIGRAQIDALPERAIVINIARGQVVDEDALIDALTEKRIAGACLDVFRVEPLPTESPLWSLDNVIVSPHSASTVATENAAITDLFIDNIGRWLEGEPLRNAYQRELGY